MAEWYPAAQLQYAGPEFKQYPKPNAVDGVVLHSMVGGLVGAFAELLRADRKASWCFSVAKSGVVYQHYPLTASTWHAGSQRMNEKYVGIEHEGGPIGNESEPLTPAQLDASVKLVWWIAQQGGWTPSRTTAQTLFEHNEVAPASSPTACPSDRIPWSAYTAAPPVDPFPSPVVKIAVRGPHGLLELPPGKWVTYDETTGEDIYSRPLPAGAFGEHTIVVGVERKQ